MPYKLVEVSNLSPEQFKAGLEFGARQLYEIRLDKLMRWDWNMATAYVMTEHNRLPTDEQICPSRIKVAEKIYRQRLETQELKDQALAQIELLNRECPLTENLIDLVISKIREDRERTQKELDFLIAEAVAVRTGTVWQLV